MFVQAICQQNAFVRGAEEFVRRSQTRQASPTVGRYRVLEKVGEGGTGTVYKAEDVRLGRLVALKFLAPRLPTDTQAIERLNNEARLAACLTHPNICSLYDIGAADGRWFIVTEYLEGETLAELLLHKVPSIEEVLDYAVQTCEGLAAAHGRGILHRDIKPSNIFLTNNNRIKLLDFGLSKVTGRRVEDGESAEGPGTRYRVSGTLRYTSPERARGLKTDCRSDIFSFGAVYYELLAGYSPFSGDTQAEVLLAVIAKDPVPIGLLRPETPPRLEELIHRCLCKEPELRCQSAKELLTELRFLSRVSRACVHGDSIRSGAW